MSKTTIFPQGSVEITVPYGQKIYISNYGGGTAIISYRSVPGNVPQEWYESQRITNTAVILGTFNLDQELRIEAGESVVQYEVGSDPGQEIIGAAPGSLELAQNAAFDGTDWTLIDSAAASRYSQDAGQHIFYNSLSGTAGDIISWLELLHANLTEIVFNESGQDRNIRFETSLDANAFSIDGGTGVIAFSNTNDLLSFDASETVFNDSGSDIDFRVESDTETHAFFMQGSDGFIGINNSQPLRPMHFINSDGTIIRLENSYLGGGSGYAEIGTVGGDGPSTSLYIGSNLNTLNYPLVQSDSSYPSWITYYYAGDYFGINYIAPGGVSTQIELFGLSSTGIIFNEPGNDVDFRVESDTITNAIFMDGATGIVSLPACYSHDMNGETYRDLLINDSGELGYDSSTIRKKTNVVDMDDVSWLYDLRPVNFEFKKRNAEGTYIDEGCGKKKYGLIAEELEEINSDFVFYDEEKRAEGVQYREFTAVLIKALQDQNARIAYLENRLMEV